MHKSLQTSIYLFTNFNFRIQHIMENLDKNIILIKESVLNDFLPRYVCCPFSELNRFYVMLVNAVVKCNVVQWQEAMAE